MLAYLFIAIALLVRFIPHPMALTPVGAALLYFGARGPRKQVWVPLTLLAASDILLNRFVYHYPFTVDNAVTWACYAGMLLLGTLLRKNASPIRVLGASLAVAVGFFTISNFAVWLVWHMYPMNFTGLLECYTAGLPFFRRELIGDVFFSAAFFGLPALFRAVRPAEAKAAA
jgi:hypothetical protein